VSAKNRGILVFLSLIAVIVVFLAIMFLFVWNEQDSGVGPLQPDAMHQPSTN
jgi:hypothetical protein